MRKPPSSYFLEPLFSCVPSPSVMSCPCAAELFLLMLLMLLVAAACSSCSSSSCWPSLLELRRLCDSQPTMSLVRGLTRSHRRRSGNSHFGAHSTLIHLFLMQRSVQSSKENTAAVPTVRHKLSKCLRPALRPQNPKSIRSSRGWITVRSRP